MLPYVLSMLGIVAVGIVIASRHGGDGVSYRVGGRVRTLVDGTADRFSPFGAAVILGAAFTGAASVITYLLGLITRHTGAFDLAVFRWTAVRLDQAGDGQSAGSFYATWSRAAQFMTDPGNKHQIWIVTTICAVALAIAYRRRFWVPILVLFCAVVSQHYLQIWIGDAVQPWPSADNAGNVPVRRNLANHRDLRTGRIPCPDPVRATPPLGRHDLDLCRPAGRPGVVQPMVPGEALAHRHHRRRRLRPRIAGRVLHRNARCGGQARQTCAAWQR